MKPIIQIKVHEGKCVGCLTCQLWCSFNKQGEVNPSKSNIRVERTRQNVFAIHFTGKCDHCGTCSHHCAYGVLQIIRKGGDNRVS